MKNKIGMSTWIWILIIVIVIVIGIGAYFLLAGGNIFENIPRPPPLPD